jgi:hypothetical protein
MAMTGGEVAHCCVREERQLWSSVLAREDRCCGCWRLLVSE